MDRIKVVLELSLLSVEVLEFGAVLVGLLAKVLDFSHQGRDRVRCDGLFVDSNKLGIIKASILGFKFIVRLFQAGVLLASDRKILLSVIQNFFDILDFFGLMTLLTVKLLTFLKDSS